MKTRVVETLCMYYMFICLACVIHNAPTCKRLSSARLVVLDKRVCRLVIQTGSGFGHITHRRERSLFPHWHRRQLLAILCTLTPTVPLCASICAYEHYMPMQVDVECAKFFVADVNTFLCRHVAVRSNNSHPPNVRATMNAYGHVSPIPQ